jgi:hypothetical protein
VYVRFRSPFLCFDQLLLFPMATVDVRVIGESSPGSTGGSGGGFGGGGFGGGGRGGGGHGRGDGGRRDMDDEEDEEEDLSKFSRRVPQERWLRQSCLRSLDVFLFLFPLRKKPSNK